MPRPPRRPAALAGKIFLARTALRQRLLIPADLRTAAWRPLFRGVYADASLTITHRHRCLAVYRYLLPSGGAIGGRSAAALYGVTVAATEDPVEVVVPRRVRFGPFRGLDVHAADLLDGDVRQLDGMGVTTPVRTSWDLAQWLDLVEAVAIIDLLIQRRLVTVADLEAYATRRSGHRGWRRLLRAATLADPGAESPRESRLRVRLVLAGVPAPVTQYLIQRGGRFLARVDLAWPEQKVAVEYDGLWHAAPPPLMILTKSLFLRPQTRARPQRQGFCCRASPPGRAARPVRV
jgi:hypothetical protein